MKCRDCGQEGFTSPNEVTNHKRTDCPARVQAKPTPEKVVPDSEPASVQEPEPNPPAEGKPEPAPVDHTAPKVEPEKPCLDDLYALASQLGVGVIVVQNSKHMVIPRRFLPDEAKYLGANAYMGVKVRGFLQKEGLVVQEQVEFLR